MRNLFVALVTLMTVAAHAETGSEVLFVPKGGESALKFGYDMGRSASYKTTTATPAEITLSGSILNFDYMYGVDNEMSVGAAFNTGSEKMEVKNFGSATNSGMSDLYLKMRMATGMWVYGADLGLPMANKVTDGDKGNRASGGISAVPMGGFVMQNGAWNFGGLVSYSYLLDRKLEDKVAATTDTASGGSFLSLTPYGEWNFGGGFVTAQFTLRSIADTKIKAAGGTETTSKATNYNTLKLGATYGFTPTITGLADYTMDMVQANDDQNTPAYTASTLAVGARMVF